MNIKVSDIHNPAKKIFGKYVYSMEYNFPFHLTESKIAIVGIILIKKLLLHDCNGTHEIPGNPLRKTMASWNRIWEPLL
jgi:hypothetical protein